MHKTVVIDIVGLSRKLIGTYTPFIEAYAKNNPQALVRPMLPALTTSVQSTYLTGCWPAEHGIVGNGWYDRTDAEIKFWKQSNKLVNSEKIWDRARRLDPTFTCANLFWWYNMYSTADYSVTPRPNYLADGRKIPDCYSHPASLRDELQRELGSFPLFQFWGPGASILSTRWIADAAIITDRTYHPTLTLVYLPHLDYCLQKLGPEPRLIARELAEIDAEVRKLVVYFEAQGARVVLCSEYGISAVHRPIHINRLLRSRGWLQVRVERGLELLDPGASEVFAVADHQVAHLYFNNPAIEPELRAFLEQQQGIAEILDRNAQETVHLNHARSGDLVLVAEPDSWFTYYYWNDDDRAPDFARTVDIHKKPGYDPVELFMTSKARAGYKLARKKLGLRYVMDVIPLDARLVKGSHGSMRVPEADYPLIISSILDSESIRSATEVYQVIWAALTGT